jgi:hypothetical protein
VFDAYRRVKLVRLKVLQLNRYLESLNPLSICGRKLQLRSVWFARGMKQRMDFPGFVEQSYNFHCNTPFVIGSNGSIQGR